MLMKVVLSLVNGWKFCPYSDPDDDILGRFVLGPAALKLAKENPDLYLEIVQNAFKEVPNIAAILLSESAIRLLDDNRPLYEQVSERVYQIYMPYQQKYQEKRYYQSLQIVFQSILDAQVSHGEESEFFLQILNLGLDNFKNASLFQKLLQLPNDEQHKKINVQESVGKNNLFGSK